MAAKHSFFTSSIGKKLLMAVTGIALFLFIVMHMLGNLQIFQGPDKINHYAEFLQGLGGLLWIARGGLLFLFGLHIIVAYQLTRENMSARPEKYIMKKRIDASWMSGYMGVLGSFILFYVVFHIFHFTLGKIAPQYYHLVDAAGRHDVYSMVIKSFQTPWIAAVYVVMMSILCAHLWHGIPSFFQTLGFRHKTLTPLIEKASPFIAIAIAAGYVAIPLSVVFGLIG